MNNEIKLVIILVISFFLFLVAISFMVTKETQKKQEICLEAVKQNNATAIQMLCEKI